MSEMLGNQYFMARKYDEALVELEIFFADNPNLKSIKRKLIVCYIQTDQLNKAIKYFHDFVKNDIEFIIKSDPIKDDCPCPEIIEQIEKSNLMEKEPDKTKLKLAMIYLFINAKKSLEYFIQSATLHTKYPEIKDITTLIEKYLINESLN